MNAELSIIVPVYNEERTVTIIMTAISSACPDAQIIYVDDGSKDQSLTLLRAHARPTDLVLTKENGGKGSAIRLGLEHATGAYTVIQDADLEYVPTEILHLLDVAKQKPGTAVFGSRFFHGKTPHIYWRFLMGNKVMTAWMNLLFFAHLTDTYTCYKLLPTSVFKELHLKSNGFELEAEITARCLRRKISIIEIPISYHPRSIEEGKKINWKDAVKGALMMAKVRCE
jgi:glycosyltransferase involved in cell wall biosynthesis